jgi:hypothetical protein
MAKPLQRISHTIWYFDANGKRIEGAHPNICGDVSDIYGNVSWLLGNVSGIWGDVSDLRGDVTWLRGDVSGLRGNCDLIPMSARPCNVADWIE